MHACGDNYPSDTRADNDVVVGRVLLGSHGGRHLSPRRNEGQVCLDGSKADSSSDSVFEKSNGAIPKMTIVVLSNRFRNERSWAVSKSDCVGQTLGT